MKNIGFIGTGIMGAPMARAIQKKYQVHAWNRTLSKTIPLQSSGIKICETALDCAKIADALIVMLSDGPTCQVVLTELIPQMRPDSIVVIMSSIPVATAQEINNFAKQHQIICFDAPVSGGENGAIAATLAIMVGGDADKFDLISDVLACMGRPVLVGESGCGQLVKLANQMIVANTITTISEAFILVKSGGADIARMKDALSGGFADSKILQIHGQRMIDQNYQPGGACKYQLKDCLTAINQAHSQGNSLPLSEKTLELYQELVASGLGDLDHSAMYKFLSDKLK